LKKLTKSQFKAASDCVTKLYYLTNNELYPSKLDKNEFLEALAEGGVQVGELARHYFPGGDEIPFSADKAAMLAQTDVLLKLENAIIYEAALQAGDYFVLVDILVKEGNRVRLVEVKSKSGQGDDESFTLKKTPTFISAAWRPYLLDIAFQTHVAELSHPEWSVEPVLMVMDKTKPATVDGLNQLFPLQIEKDAKGRERAVAVKNPDITPEKIGESIMVEYPMRDIVDSIFNGTYTDIKNTEFPENLGFKDWAAHLAGLRTSGQREFSPIGAKCKGCEFRYRPDELEPGKRSGFVECWKHALSLKDRDFNRPMLFEVNRITKTEDRLQCGQLFLDDAATIKPDEFAPISAVLNASPPYEDVWDQKARQALQIHSVQTGATDEAFIHPHLKDELQSWTFPLHFIDFEASRTAIPFHKGMHPYEVSVFQFSIHTAYEDGRIEHRSEFLHLVPGEFPNFAFIRALKDALGETTGSVLTWSGYENTCLRHIRQQLISSSVKQPDAAQLIDFIDSLIYDKDRGHTGRRLMVDMLEVEKKYYYHSATKGSNSIKYVLPAVLNASVSLKQKYGAPVYTSRNYSGMQWAVRDANGRFKDPYALLKETDPLTGDSLTDNLTGEPAGESITNGGQAMIEWARVQFGRLSHAEVERIRKALLRYCELDTLAMAMIWEGWRVNS
jgi:hypothetical protein